MAHKGASLAIPQWYFDTDISRIIGISRERIRLLLAHEISGKPIPSNLPKPHIISMIFDPPLFSLLNALHPIAFHSRTVTVVACAGTTGGPKVNPIHKYFNIESIKHKKYLTSAEFMQETNICIYKNGLW